MVVSTQRGRVRDGGFRNKCWTRWTNEVVVLCYYNGETRQKKKTLHFYPEYRHNLFFNGIKPYYYVFGPGDNEHEKISLWKWYEYDIFCLNNILFLLVSDLTHLQYVSYREKAPVQRFTHFFIWFLQCHVRQLYMTYVTGSQIRPSYALKRYNRLENRVC